VRALAMRYLPWAVSLPVVSVAGFQLDGVFIGATRVRELRDSMLVSFLLFLSLAIGLERFFGNNGLWFAFCGFMAMRGVMLALRLPRIERTFQWTAPVSRGDQITKPHHSR
jgi:MATE family multidrug resistance protein